jgi:hypothetical protein
LGTLIFPRLALNQVPARPSVLVRHAWILAHEWAVGSHIEDSSSSFVSNQIQLRPSSPRSSRARNLVRPATWSVVFPMETPSNTVVSTFCFTTLQLVRHSDAISRYQSRSSTGTCRQVL